MTTPRQSAAANSVQHALELTREAEALQREILQALTAGEREQAEKLCLQHQRIITSIPFAELTGELPQTLVAALQRLLTGNNTLAAMTEEIQREIGQQLSQVQKGITGSRAYDNIDKQR